eukprot:350491_1
MSNRDNSALKISENYSKEPFLFEPHEIVVCLIKNVNIFRHGSVITYTNKLLVITNYRTVVMVDNNHKTLKNGDNIISALTILHHSVYAYNSDEYDNRIQLETKDYRTIIINLSTALIIQTLASDLPQSWEERIDENGKPYFVDAETGEWYRVKGKQHQRIDTNEKLSIITAESKKEFERAQYLVTMKRFLLSSEEQYVFAFTEYCNINTTKQNSISLYMQLKDTRFNISHTEYLIKKEYQRLGWNENEKNCSLRVTQLNQNYNFCPTYPTLLLIPQNVTDNLIIKAAQYRARNRVPVITWCNSHKISLSRSSQPICNVFSNKINKYDKELLSLLNKMNTCSETFLICHCRPQKTILIHHNFKHNYKNNYENTKMITIDMDNIHMIRRSINELKMCCQNKQFDVNWLQKLSNMEWFKHMAKIIQYSQKIANLIDKYKHSVLIHCTDGWDRTSQICCLTQLLLDPYYRTFEGFLILIQKEWLWFSHKFGDRNVNYFGRKKK